MNTELPERFIAKVAVDDASGCWVWTGALSEGYGRFQIGEGQRRLGMAHRFAYESLVGPIPSGLQIDHLCRNRACVNPAHLEPVTQRENLMRGETIVARQARATYCPRGHEYTPENTHRDRRGRRDCWTCRRMRKSVAGRAQIAALDRSRADAARAALAEGLTTPHAGEEKE